MEILDVAKEELWLHKSVILLTSSLEIQSKCMFNYYVIKAVKKFGHFLCKDSFILFVTL